MIKRNPVAKAVKRMVQRAVPSKKTYNRKRRTRDGPRKNEPRPQ